MRTARTGELVVDHRTSHPRTWREEINKGAKAKREVVEDPEALNDSAFTPFPQVQTMFTAKFATSISARMLVTRFIRAPPALHYKGTGMAFPLLPEHCHTGTGRR
jgi:hypothetical protein